LREACQTDIDGTSIDALEVVANKLGLEAEQVMVPPDHVLIDPAKNLPAIIVVQLSSGLTHFVVAWRRHGNIIQVMDPAMGRRWVPAAQFESEFFNHVMVFPASDWLDFARTEDFSAPLLRRIRELGISESEGRDAIRRAQDSGWKNVASLDAAVRMLAQMVHARGVSRGIECERLLETISNSPDLIPERYWTVRAAGEEDGSEHVKVRGAILVRIIRKARPARAEELGTELAAAITERPISPARELLRLMWQSGVSAPFLLLLALAAGAAGVIIEALLFRGLFDLAGELAIAGQRAVAMAALLIFSACLLGLEMAVFSGGMRLGRQVETRLRVAFLTKVPRLGDQYFHSRLTSDMAERSHSTHRLRHLPELGRRLARAVFELLATAGGIIWIDPVSAPYVLLAVAAALAPPFTTQRILSEQDLRVRTHAAGLSRFYLDALLGLLPIRAHSAERSVRKEHEGLLGKWGEAALRFQRTVMWTGAVQLLATFGLVAALFLQHPLGGDSVGKLLLVVYWALNLPSIGQDIAALARQQPYYRNITLRLLDPLGAPEEEPTAHDDEAQVIAAPPEVVFEGVTAQAAGHTILREINLRIAPGTHVAIVGPSGAGKSSLLGLLLGWLKPNEGSINVGGSPLNCDSLRRSAAWVDPAVQLWNRSLASNLSYGSHANAAEVGHAIDAAMLRNVLEALPQGLQTKLGEGGALVSGGEGQRVRMGRALLRRDAQLALLDEPFRGLDREKRRELLQTARANWRGRTMLCVTHDLAETQGFDRVLVIEHGRIVEDGTPEELCSRTDSRYSQLLEAEEQTRSGAWGSSSWRRVRIHSGRIIEERLKTVEGKRPESEVA
jgi:ATP-binding cassette subfamily B protein